MKNRFQNSLTASNVQIAYVLTDTFGKTSQSILKLMLENPNIQLDNIKPLIQKCIKATSEDIFKEIDRSFNKSQSSKISVYLSHYEAINDYIDTLEQSILKFAIKYTDEINLLWCNESNNKKKSVKITKTGVYIKPLLVQCALCAIKDKSCPYFRMKYATTKENAVIK